MEQGNDSWYVLEGSKAPVDSLPIPSGNPTAHRSPPPQSGPAEDRETREGVDVLADMLGDLCELLSRELKSWEEPTKRKAADCISQLESLLDRGKVALGKMRLNLSTPRTPVHPPEMSNEGTSTTFKNS